MVRRLSRSTDPLPDRAAERQRIEEYFGIHPPEHARQVAAQCLSDCEFLQERMHHQAEALQAIRRMLESQRMDGLDHPPVHRNDLAALFAVMGHHADSLTREMTEFLQPVRELMQESRRAASA